jgi:two-component sensor histidine kinase
VVGWSIAGAALACVAALCISLFGAHGGAAWIATLVVVAAALAGVMTIMSLARALDQVESERNRAEALAESRQTLFRELHHRIANNMQVVSSLLSLQSRRVTDADSGRAALREAMRRLDTLARVHRRLNDPQQAGRDPGSLLTELCRDVVSGSGAASVALRVEVSVEEIRQETLTPLSLIVVELVANALKHGFADGNGGTLAVGLHPAAPGRLLLEVRDDGPGIADDAIADADSGARLGARIVQSLAHQLRGQLSVERDGGTVARVEFDA